MRFNQILFLMILLLHVILYAIVGNPFSLVWFGDLAQGIALVIAAIQFSRAAISSERKEERSRFLIAIGLWIWLMAHALLSYSELLLERPATGTVTDIIWLIGYGLIVRSFYLMVNERVAKHRAIRWHAGLLILIAVIVVSILWRAVTDHERSLSIKLIQVVFPCFDLWIAAAAFLFVHESGDKRWLLAGFGSLIIGTADLIFPFFYTMSSPVYRYMDIPLFVGYSTWWMLGAALLTPKTQKLQGRV